MSVTPGERHAQIADAVAADVLANWGTDPAFTAAAGDECRRSYGRAFDFANDPPIGRKVWVFTAPNGWIEETLARGVVDYRFPVVLGVLERYTGDEAEVPTAWVDERLAWVGEQFRRLQDQNRDPVPDDSDAAALNDVDPEEATPEYTYDPDLLAYEKAFAAQFMITFRDGEFDG